MQNNFSGCRNKRMLDCRIIFPFLKCNMLLGNVFFHVENILLLYMFCKKFLIFRVIYLFGFIDHSVYLLPLV